MKTAPKIPFALLLGVLATVSTAAGAPPPPTIAVDVSPEPELSFIGSPSIAILPDGSYVASHDFFGPRTPLARITRVFGSQDRGANWEQLAQLSDSTWGTLFVHRGGLYLLSITKEYGDIALRRSSDGGRTWTTPTDARHGLLFAGRFHCGPVPVVVQNGRVWRAVEEVVNDQLWPRHFASLVISAPEKAELLDASNWIRTNSVLFDPSWVPGRRPGWLEGNAVIAREGGIVNLLRVNAEIGPKDEFALQGPAAGIPRYEVAAQIRISADGRQAAFDPATGFFHLPGSQTKFTIRYDPVSNRYWSLVNKITLQHEGREQELDPAAQRNVVELISSPDLRSWLEHSKVLRWRDGQKLSRHDHFAFQYLDWQFDGADLVAVSRTSWEGQSFHNSNYLTFHRVKNFRTQTMADSAPDLGPASRETGRR